MPLPELKLRVEPDELSPLADRLRELKYEEGAMSQLLGVWDLSMLDVRELPQYVWKCRQDRSDLGRLGELFLLGEGLSRDVADNLLGKKLLSALMMCGVLFRRTGKYFCHAVLYPCQGHFFFTDYWVTEGQVEGQVYELGTDSYVLTRVTSRQGVKSALDLCTGSGIHAIMSATVCGEATAVDINPRALEFTRLNAALNGAVCHTQLADLYSGVKGECYDLITANPPFVPSPDSTVLIHRSAGESGEEVPERLVAGLPEHLQVGGLFSMILEYPVFQQETYLERLQRWLGHERGWGIAILSFGEMALGPYIKKHVGADGDYTKKFESYLESYQKQGIKTVDFANVFIKREGTDAPNWTSKKTCPWPNVSIQEQVEDWLANLSAYNSPQWKPEERWKPALSKYFKTLWRDLEQTQGQLEASELSWLPPDMLNRDEAELLSLMRGEKTVAELRGSWLEQGRDEESFLRAFRGLGLNSAIS